MVHLFWKNMGNEKTITEGLHSLIKTNNFATKFVKAASQKEAGWASNYLFSGAYFAVSFREGMDLTFLPYLFQLTPPKTNIFLENQWLEAKMSF